MKLKKLLMIGMVIITCNQIQTYANTTDYSVSVSGVPKFDSSDLTVRAQITSEQLRKVMPSSMEELANDIVWFSESKGLNSLFVASLIREESGNNTSKLAVNNNNVAGIKINGKYHTFKSKTECIDKLTTLLKDEYLTDTGKFFNGYSIKDVSIMYNLGCKEWTKNISDMCKYMLKNIG